MGTNKKSPLREIPALYGAVLDVIENLVIVLDSKGTVAEFNRACEKATGYQRDEVLGRPFWEKLLPDEEIEPVKQAFRALASGMFPNTHENYWRTHDGKRILTRWSNNALLDKNGEVEWVVGTGLDITNIRRLESERAVFEDIVHASPDFIATADLQGKLLFFNKGGLARLGLSNDDIKDMNIPDCHPEWAVDIVANVGLPAASEHGVWVGESAFKKRNGEEVPVSQLIIAHRDADGEISYFSTVARDITELQQARTLIEAQVQEIHSLSTPILGVWQGIVVAPLIGSVDSVRATQFCESLLEQIAQRSVNTAIVDITGVPTIDTATAQHLLETFIAVRLLGAKVILTGVGPSMARTMTQLGITLEGVETFAALSQGLAWAIKRDATEK